MIWLFYIAAAVIVLNLIKGRPPRDRRNIKRRQDW